MKKKRDTGVRRTSMNTDSSPEGAKMEGDLDSWTLPGMDYPTFRLSLVAKIMDRMTLRYFAELSDLTMPEWRVLLRLCIVGEMTVGQLAEQAWVDPAETSRAAASLETRGWISRRENPKDRRTPILFATKTGRTIYRPLAESRGRFHEDLLSDLTPIERTLLDSLIKKLAARLLTMNSKAVR